MPALDEDASQSEARAPPVHVGAALRGEILTLPEIGFRFDIPPFPLSVAAADIGRLGGDGEVLGSSRGVVGDVEVREATLVVPLLENLPDPQLGAGNVWQVFHSRRPKS